MGRNNGSLSNGKSTTHAGVLETIDFFAPFCYFRSMETIITDSGLYLASIDFYGTVKSITDKCLVILRTGWEAALDADYQTGAIDCKPFLNDVLASKKYKNDIYMLLQGLLVTILDGNIDPLFINKHGNNAACSGRGIAKGIREWEDRVKMETGLNLFGCGGGDPLCSARFRGKTKYGGGDGLIDDEQRRIKLFLENLPILSASKFDILTCIMRLAFERASKISTLAASSDNSIVRNLLAFVRKLLEDDDKGGVYLTAIMKAIIDCKYIAKSQCLVKSHRVNCCDTVTTLDGQYFRNVADIEVIEEDMVKIAWEAKREPLSTPMVIRAINRQRDTQTPLYCIVHYGVCKKDVYEARKLLNGSVSISSIDIDSDNSVKNLLQGLSADELVLLPSDIVRIAKDELGEISAAEAAGSFWNETVGS